MDASLINASKINFPWLHQDNEFISYEAVHSSKLLFLFYPGCKWLSWGGVLFTPG
jgi:hypothetical protein